MIPFNVPLIIGNEVDYIRKTIQNKKLCGDGVFTEKCNKWLENYTKTKKALLTTSCTHALEMAAILINAKEGDEIIMPSYTFTSTANAFALHSAKINFVDIRPDTMNIDEKKIERAITDKTKAIVPVHYAGISCDMDAIMSIAVKYNLFVIEDAAQGIMANYKGKALGSIGHIGCYSFHETKNYTCGEGGAILINDERFIKRVEIIREKGANRSQFFRGEVDKYTWQDIGSSYLPSEINAAFLFAQFEKSEEINSNRIQTWEQYYSSLKPLEENGYIELPKVPTECKHNGHMFYIKLKNLDERARMISYLKKNGICAFSHYVPLHSSPAGLKLGIFHGDDRFTTRESERLLRLPLFYGMSMDDIYYICEKIEYFYKGCDVDAE